MTGTHRHAQNSAEVAAHAAALLAFYGEPISTYSRAEAVRDGLFVDVTGTREHREKGMQTPVHLSAAVYDQYVKWGREDNARQTYQDETGRLWDMLGNYLHACGRMADDAQVLPFGLMVVPRAEGSRARTARLVRLIAFAGPNDDHTPLITIYTVDEAQAEGLL